MARLSILLFVYATFANFLMAQQPTFQSHSNVVLVPTLVKDAKGNPLYGLQANDFVIEDDGVQQIPQLDEEEGEQPVSIVVAVQRGRSAVAEFQRIKTLGTMIDPVVSAGEARVAIITFDSRITQALDFTDNASAIASALQNVQPGDGGAAILDAISYSVAKLSRLPKGSRRVLLLVSETRDHGSHAADVDQVVMAIGSSNTVVYTLCFRPSASNLLDTFKHGNEMPVNAAPDLLAPILMARQAMRRNIPSTIASMTGGEYEVFKSRKTFEYRMTDFANHLHSRYMLSFQPKNPKPGLHTIRVLLREPEKGAFVLARSSYWAN